MASLRAKGSLILSTSAESISPPTTLARKFFRPPCDAAAASGHSAGKDMTKLMGIAEINKDALVCDFAFDPCGYSMNDMNGGWYSTIHVTPEDGYSYASFECVGSTDTGDVDMDIDVARVFRSLTIFNRTPSKAQPLLDMGPTRTNPPTPSPPPPTSSSPSSATPPTSTPSSSTQPPEPSPASAPAESSST